LIFQILSDIIQTNAKKDKYMTKTEIRRTIEILKESALKAGIVLKDCFRNSVEIEFKGENDLVTDADRKSEKILVDFISKIFPDYGIIAEEGSNKEKNSKYRFIIDPLDGTTNFAHKYPFYSISIGLLKDDEPIIGIVYAPHFEEMFYAGKGMGAFLNGKKISVSETQNIKDSLLVTGFAYQLDKYDNLDYFRKIIKKSRGVRRDGSAALDLCYVANGRFDGFWELGLHPWDQAAGAVILREAGGTITDFSKNKWSPFDKELVATNFLIHDQMINALK